MFLNLNNFSIKQYQEEVIDQVNLESSFIIMPTGSGKTVILAKLIDLYLKKGIKRHLVIGPKKILIEQHYKFFKNNFENVFIFISRAEDVKTRFDFLKTNENIIVITTAHLMHMHFEKIKNFFNILYIDEIHHLTLAEPYVNFCNWPNLKYKFGFSAHLGNKERIEELKLIYQIDKIIYSTGYKPILSYEKIFFDMPSYKIPIFNMLKEKLDVQIKKLRPFMIVKNNSFWTNYDPKANIGNNYATSLYYNGLKLEYLYNLIGTQPIETIRNYISNKNLKSFLDLKTIMQLQNYLKINEIDLKFIKIKQIIAEINNPKIIIFCSYINTAKLLHDYLSKIFPNVFLLIGQNSTVKLKNQKITTMEFNTINSGILISTSVGEEGLDLARVENILCYDIPSSIIKNIQRQGRTARDDSSGKVIYLINKDTKDEFNYYKFKKSVKTDI